MTTENTETQVPIEGERMRAAPPWLAEALEDWHKAKAAVSIDPLASEIPASLNAELIQFPEEVARWGFRVAEAAREVQMSELLEDDCWAASLEKAKMVLGPLVRGTTNAADYERAARQDPEWRKARIKHIHADAKLGRLKSAMEALRTKREALMSLGANLRQEMERDPSLRQR